MLKNEKIKFPQFSFDVKEWNHSLGIVTALVFFVSVIGFFYCTKYYEVSRTEYWRDPSTGYYTTEIIPAKGIDCLTFYFYSGCLYGVLILMHIFSIVTAIKKRFRKGVVRSSACILLLCFTFCLPILYLFLFPPHF